MAQVPPGKPKYCACDNCRISGRKCEPRSEGGCRRCFDREETCTFHGPPPKEFGFYRGIYMETGRPDTRGHFISMTTPGEVTETTFVSQEGASSAPRQPFGGPSGDESTGAGQQWDGASFAPAVNDGATAPFQGAQTVATGALDPFYGYYPLAGQQWDGGAAPFQGAQTVASGSLDPFYGYYPLAGQQWYGGAAPFQGAQTVASGSLDPFYSYYPLAGQQWDDASFAPAVMDHDVRSNMSNYSPYL